MQALGRFEVEKLVAKDTLAEVWRGLDPATNNPVAIRILKSVRELGSNELQQFHQQFRELAAAAKTIDHPNVARMVDFDIRGQQQPYVVLEFVEGETLAASMSKASMPPALVASLGEQLARALAAGHQIGLTHGDIRPNNLMRAADGTVKLTEFAIIRLAEQTYGGAGRFLRSPAFCAPEVIGGDKVTPAADVFALGATLYALLTGTEPFVGASLAETARAVCDRPLTPPSQMRPGLAAEWNTILGRALEKQPAARFGSAAEMATALATLASGPAENDAEAQIGTLVVERSPEIESEIRLMDAEAQLGGELGGLEDMLALETRKVRLRVKSGPQEGKTFTLSETFHIGRLGAPIGVGDPRVSRRHARLQLLDDGTVLLTDLASSNGTYFRGQRIQKARLRPGDEFEVGSSTIVLEVDDSED